MNVLVCYSSKTGCTKRIAEAIQAREPSWDCLPIDQVASLEKYDLVFLGGWIDKGAYDAKTSAFIELLSDKAVAFFFTLGAYPTSKHAYDCIQNIRQALEERKNTVINHFHCQGAIDPKLIEWMKGLGEEHAHAPDKYREQRWKDASLHPNQEDCNAAESFADFTVKLYEKARQSNV